MYFLSFAATTKKVVTKKVVIWRIPLNFKYRTIVDVDYFTDRIDEVKYISQFVNSR